MRDIKFRVWNKHQKDMIYNIEGICNESYCSNIRGDYWFSGILMQFSNFKDKNNNDIYEHDIVYFKANYTSKRSGWLKGVFIYDETNYYRPSIKVGYDIYDIGEETDEFPYTCEVLGNIYENPNLIVVL